MTNKFLTLIISMFVGALLFSSCQDEIRINKKNMDTIDDLVYRYDPRTNLCFAGTPFLFTNNAFLTHVPCTDKVIAKMRLPIKTK